MRNSIVYLAKNIKLDKNYKNVLKYSESDMINLITNQNNLVYSGNNFSYIREENSIQMEIPYGIALQSNYLAFQNPDYSNKWFFAFIDKVEYISNKVTKINFTVDLFSTWWSYWSPKACYVIREHVASDNIGEHTVPENVETGDYVVVDAEDLEYIEYDNQKFFVCAGISEDILTNNTPDKFYNGVVSGLTYIALKTNFDVNRLITRYNTAGKIDAIYSLFMIPAFNAQWTQDATGLVNFAYITSSNTFFDVGEINISRSNYLGNDDVGYIPKNNKLLTYPYIYILADNNAGSTAIYKYEYFKNPLMCNFKSIGSISAGCNIKTVPLNYKGVEADTSTMIEAMNFGESLNNAKLPIGSWTNDVYTNWLTQNGVNIATSLLSGTLQVAGGVLMAGSGAGAVAGAGNIASGGLSIASTIGQVYQHSLAPDQAEGNVNSSDVMFSAGKIAPTFYRMTIKREFAEIIDGYFSRMGYQVNKVKIPNMLHRQNFNYVMIGNEETLCYCNNYNNIMIPASDLNNINNMFRLGVTLWNNHNNLGDYSVSNNIN